MNLSRDKVMFQVMADLLKIHNQFIKKVSDLDEIVNKKVGPKGERGEKGKDGDTVVGPRGPKGDPGKNGDSIVGPQGPEGKPGKISEREKKELVRILKDSIKIPDFQAIPTIDDILVQLKKKKLSSSDIFDLNEKFETLRREIRSVSKMRGGGDTVIAGNNVSIAVDSNGNKVISSTGTGGGSWLTPIGTVDGSNNTFTVASEPTMVMVDGMGRIAGLDYTYAGLTIVLVVPPQDWIRYM